MPLPPDSDAARSCVLRAWKAVTLRSRYFATLDDIWARAGGGTMPCGGGTMPHGWRRNHWRQGHSDPPGLNAAALTDSDRDGETLPERAGCDLDPEDAHVSDSDGDRNMSGYYAVSLSDCESVGDIPPGKADSATRLGDSDLESGEIPDSDLESDNGSDLSSLAVAALGNASFGSLASRMAGRASDPVEGGMICKIDQGCVYPEDVMSCKRCACIYYVVLIRCCLRVNIIDFPGHLLLSQIRRGGFRRRLLLRRKSGH